MSDEIHEKILRFIEQTIALDKDETCLRIVLNYSPSGMYRNDEIRSWRRDSPIDGPCFERGHVFIKRFAQDIIELAESHADSYGPGKHRFMLRATLAVGRRTHPFTILPSGDAAAASGFGDGSTGALATPETGMIPGVPGSAPNIVGVVAQLMRHVESKERSTLAMLQTMMGAIGHHTQQQRDENNDLRSENAQLRKERSQYLEQIEAAKSVEHQQQIEAATVSAREERKNLATKKFLSLAPVAISQWMSVKSKGAVGDMAATAGAPTPLAIAAGELFGSLTGDQRGKLEGLLSIEGRFMLSEISRVVTAGGSPLLPTLIHDLIRSFDMRQMSGLMAMFSAEQQGSFVRVMQLATAATAGESGAPAPAQVAQATPANDGQLAQAVRSEQEPEQEHEGVA